MVSRNPPGALQRLVLQQHGLHQRIDGVGRALLAARNGVQRIAVARRSLDLAEPVEQIVNQLAFLRCHNVLRLKRA
jgi:hypothetical protein